MSGNMYDQSCMTYSPDGRMYQVEYAEKAITTGETIVGVKCKDGIILGAEKQVFSRLLEEDTNRRIGTIDSSKGMVICGILPDGRHLVNRAKEEADQYLQNYDITMSGLQLADRLAQYLHAYTLYHQYRPLGTVGIIASYNSFDGYKLSMVEHDGNNYSYHACTVGKGKQIAKAQLEKYDFKNYTCREALKYVAKMLHLTHEEYKDKKFELDLAWISDETNQVFERVDKATAKEAEKQGLDIIDQEDQE